MTALLNLLSHILTWLFFAGLAGACIVIVLFLADLFRTLSTEDSTTNDDQPISG